MEAFKEEEMFIIWVYGQRDHLSKVMRMPLDLSTVNLVLNLYLCGKPLGSSQLSQADLIHRINYCLMKGITHSFIPLESIWRCMQSSQIIFKCKHIKVD